MPANVATSMARASTSSGDTTSSRIPDETALVGVPVERFEPVGEAVVDALLTVLFGLVSEAGELLVETEESCAP